MRIRLVMAIAATFLLAGCGWMGPPFYKGDPADAGPIRPGRYKIDILGDGRLAHSYRVAWLPDGSAEWTPLKPKENEAPWRQIAVRFVAQGRQLWILQDMPDHGRSDVSYGLAERRADTLWMMPFIDCDATADIVRAAGGEVAVSPTTDVAEANEASPKTGSPTPRISDKPTGQRCRFKDQASLERALRAYVATNPSWLRVRFERIGD